MYAKAKRAIFDPFRRMTHLEPTVAGPGYATASKMGRFDEKGQKWPFFGLCVHLFSGRPQDWAQNDLKVIKTAISPRSRTSVTPPKVPSKVDSGTSK